MEPKCSCGGPSSEFEFGFAFNDSNFSDRVLRVEIMPDPVDAPYNSNSVTAVADGVHHRKRTRKNDLDMDDGVPGENQEQETVQEFPRGDESANNNFSAATVVRVETLHISSPILAAKSPFFYKLLSNGMMESEQKHVTIKILASEEASLMGLLNFMYRNTLNITAPAALVGVLTVADKFGVTSCMRYCSQLLLNSPMTPHSALLCLELPHTVVMADVVQPLTDAAKQYLVDRYKDIKRFEEEVMALPLSGIEVILASDDLQVESEDDLYDFVLNWARQHYNRLEERQEVLGTRLARLIRFPYMTCKKLKNTLTCIDFKHQGASRFVSEAIIFKAEAAEESASLKHWRFAERAYKCRPVKVVRFELPRQRCVVYLDLKREECANLFPSGQVCSQTFYFGGQVFFLSAICIMHQQSSLHWFCMFLEMQKNSSSVSFAVDYEVAIRHGQAEAFVSGKVKNAFTSEVKVVGRKDLLKIPWNSFMAEGSRFFINGVFHFRTELTIRHG